MSADVWAERLVLSGAEPVACYLNGPGVGGPAITRHRVGAGTARYISTRINGAYLDAVLRQAGMSPMDLPDGVEVVHCAGDAARYLVAINHSGRDAELAGAGKELLTGAPCHGCCLYQQVRCAYCA